MADSHEPMAAPPQELTRARGESAAKPRARFLSRFVTIVVTFLACAGAYYVGSVLAANRHREASAETASTDPATIRGLYIDPATLDLGELWEEPERVVTLKLENRGDATVRVLDFGASCECTSVSPRQMSIASGQSSEIHVKLDLMHRMPQHFGLERRPLSVRIDPVLDTTGRPVAGWELKAIIHSRVSLESRMLAFDDKCVQYGPPATRKMHAVAHVPIKSLEVAADPSIASLRVEPVAGKPGHFAIAVTPNPKLPIGKFDFQVRTTAVLPDGTRCPCASSTVRGEMLPPARIVPGVVLLGERVVGETAKAEVSVRLPDGAGWAIDHIEVDAPDTAITPKLDRDEKKLRFTIAQKIAEPGDQTRDVRFIVREPTGRTESCPMKIMYYGKPAGR